ncbi:MAG: EAL domain-containing protein [Pseudomonadota bacterium]
MRPTWRDGAIHLGLGGALGLLANALGASVGGCWTWWGLLALVSAINLARSSVFRLRTDRGLGRATVGALFGMIWTYCLWLVPGETGPVQLIACALATVIVIVLFRARSMNDGLAFVTGALAVASIPITQHGGLIGWFLTTGACGVGLICLGLRTELRALRARIGGERDELEAVINALHHHYDASDRERTPDVADDITEAALVLDDEHRIHWANQTAYRIAHAVPVELEGQAIDTVFRLWATDDERTVSWTDVLASSAPVSLRVEDPVGMRYPVQIRRIVRDAGHTVLIRNLTEVIGLQRFVQFSVERDSMTGLLNRKALERRVATAQRESSLGEPAAIIFLRVMQYPSVMDACGFSAADELLQQVVGVLYRRLRQSDTLARLDGGDFGIVLRRCAFSQAETIAEELRDAVNSLRFHWESQSFELTVSLGVVAINAEDHPQMTMSRALSALQTATEGRNRIYASPPVDAARERQLVLHDWRQRVQKALDTDQFHIYVQPIAPCRGQTFPPQGISHVELLLRMHDVDGSPIPAKDFLTAAEHYDMMPTVDKWVLRKTLGELSRRPDDNAIHRFGINLSGQSLSDPCFLTEVIEALDHFAIDNSRIYFEITETAAIANLELVRLFMAKLKARGCVFALDDFGVGSSSFAYLTQLPVDFLKIDGAFIRRVNESPSDRAVVESIVQMAVSLKLKTVAEYVEHEETFRTLAQIGVDHAQGAAIGSPLPLADHANSQPSLGDGSTQKG